MILENEKKRNKYFMGIIRKERFQKNGSKIKKVQGKRQKSLEIGKKRCKSTGGQSLV